MQAAVNKAYTRDTIVSMENCQAGFTYSEEDQDAIVLYVSQERLAPYFVLVQNAIDPSDRRRKAIGLYERNTQISEALYGVMQGFEVTFRNAVHNRLVQDLGENWLETFSFLDSERASINDAKKNIRERGCTLTVGRIIAELNFGFWVRLFSPQYSNTLWGPSLSKIVPLRHGKARSTVQGRIQGLKTLRNRIAHHNRIIGQTRNGKPVLAKEIYAEILEVLGWFSKTIRFWVESTNSFEILGPNGKLAMAARSETKAAAVSISTDTIVPTAQSIAASASASASG
jgi:hypothetical protein